MTGLIVQKQLEEIVSSKSDIISMGIIVVACGIITPFFSNMYFAILSPTLTMAFIAHMSRSIFLEEKDSRSEILQAFPAGMKQFCYGKALSCFFVSLLLFWLSFGLGLITSLIRYGSIIFTWKQELVFVSLVSLAFWAFAWLSTYLSFMSKNSGACILTLTFASILFSAPPIILFVFLVRQVDTVVKWPFLSFQIDLVLVICAYVIIMVLAFVIPWVLIVKYRD